RGNGAADYLHALDEVNIQRELGPSHGLVVNVVVEAMSVDQQENTSIEIPRPIQAAYADKTVVTVIRHIESTDGSEDVGEGSIPVLLDLISRNYRDRGRGFFCALQVPGGAVHLDLA